MKSGAKGERLILDLLDGFFESKVLMTAYRLDVFTALADTPLPCDEAVSRLGLPARAGTILLNACLTLGLLEEHAGGLRTPPELLPLLIRGADQPFRISAYLIEYYEELYRDFVQLDEIVRSDGAASGFKRRDYFKDDVSTIDPQLAADYSGYMNATMDKILEVVRECYSFAGRRYLLDLCGGTGRFCRAILEAHPQLRGAFIDVPAVVALAPRHAAAAQLAERLVAIPGDVFRDPLPQEADVITICRSAHDWDEPRISELFQRVFHTLPSGGEFLIIERMLPEQFTPAARALYLRALYFLSKSQTACYRTAGAYEAILKRIGFVQIHVLSPPRDPYLFFQGMKILVARKAVSA